MKFYGDARKGHDFEAGIKAALQALLASPKFVFRFESTPTLAKAGPDLPHQRSRSGVAAVVLPLEHGAGRRAA